MLSKADYIAWRDSKETQEMLSDAKEALESAAQELLTREDYYRDRDQFLKGFIKGLESVMTWRPEFTEEQQDAS